MNGVAAKPQLVLVNLQLCSCVLLPVRPVHPPCPSLYAPHPHPPVCEQLRGCAVRHQQHLCQLCSAVDGEADHCRGCGTKAG